MTRCLYSDVQVCRLLAAMSAIAETLDKGRGWPFMVAAMEMESPVDHTIYCVQMGLLRVTPNLHLVSSQITPFVA